MHITHKTLVKNKLGRTINYDFFDKHGVSFGPGETKILEGIYPSACKNKACIRNMEAALSAGRIEVSIITNLPVLTTNVKSAPATIDTLQPATVVKKDGRDIIKEDGIQVNQIKGHEKVVDTKPAEKGEVERVVKVDVSDGDDTVSGRWKKTPHAEEQPTKSLPGMDTDIQKPEVKPMFPEDASVVTQPELYDPVVKEQSMREALQKAEEADQKLQAHARKEAEKKTRKRKAPVKPAADSTKDTESAPKTQKVSADKPTTHIGRKKAETAADSSDK